MNFIFLISRKEKFDSYNFIRLPEFDEDCMSAAIEQNREERMDSEAPRMNGMAFAASGKEDTWTMEKYFAREGVDPLSRAFDGKIAVHPGVGGGMVPPEEMEACLETLLDRPRQGDSVAYIHVPFCETHCLYCGFYNRGYSREESARYADALIDELRLWEKRRPRNRGPCMPCTSAEARPRRWKRRTLRDS